MNRGLRLVLRAFAGIAWFVLVFALSIYLTFPADAVAKRFRWQVQEGSGGSAALQLGSVKPWWLGVRLDDVAWYRKDKPRRGAESGGDAELLFAADSVRVRTGFLSLLSLAGLGGEASFTGSTTLEGGDLDFSGTLGRGDGERLKLHALQVEGDGFPLNALPSIAGGKLVGQGGLDLDLELDAAEGMSKSNGHLTLGSTDLLIERIDAPGLEGFDLGQIKVSQVDVAFDVNEGKAKVSRGTITSDLVQAELEGDVMLADDLPKSRLRLKIVFTLGDQLDMFAGFLKDAKWEDGKFHYALSGTLDRPRFRPERERRARPASAPHRALPSPDEGEDLGAEGPPPGDRVGPPGSRLRGPMFDRPPIVDGGAPNADAAREERARRREEAIAARRARMQEQRDELGDEPVRPDRLDEEDLRPEDLPIDDGPVPLDDELLPPDELAIPEDDQDLEEP